MRKIKDRVERREKNEKKEGFEGRGRKRKKDILPLVTKKEM